MPRAVRFEEANCKSPDELASPHHTLKNCTPKGILLKSGTFEQRTLKNGRYTPRHVEKRSRRYSTPVLAEKSLNMQNTSAPEAYHSHQRSVSGDLHSAVRHQSQLASLRQIHSGQMARLPLSPLESSFNIPSEAPSSYKPYIPHTPYHHSSTRSRRHEDDYYAQEQRGYSDPSAAWAAYTNTASEYDATARNGSSSYRQSYYPSVARSEPEPRRLSLKDVVVHRHLEQPRITWNIVFPFSSAIFDSYSKLRVSELDSPATVPAVDKVTIKFDHSRIHEQFGSSWRSMKVRGSQPIDYNGTVIAIVTIRDVLNAVFEFFQVPLTREEYKSVPAPQAQIILDAQRNRLGGHLYQAPGSLGDPLRVDLLGGLTRFEGVQITSLKEKRLTFGLNLGPWSPVF